LAILGFGAPKDSARLQQLRKETMDRRMKQREKEK